MRASPRDSFLVLLLAVLIAVGFVGGALLRSGGHPMFPLDDAFIYLQTARQTSQLHLFEYFPGQGHMTGATSVLWTLLEVPAFWTGLNGARVIPWVWILSGLIWVAAALLMLRIGLLFAGRGCGLIAAGLFLAHGHLAWAHWNGLETGLFALEMLVAVWALERWVGLRAERRSPGRWPWVAWIATAALTLTRPEGLGLAVVAALLITWRSHRGQTGAAQAFGWWLATAPGLLMLLVNRLATGWWGTNGLGAKGIMTDPYWTLGEKLHAIAQNWSDLWFGLHAGSGDVIWFFRDGAAPWVGPLVLLFALIGVGPGLAGLWQRGQGEGASLAALWYLLGTAAVCTSAVAFAHLARYFVAFLPLLLLLAALGVHEFAQLWRSRAPHITATVGATLVCLAAPSLLWWGQVYAENCQDIFEQHRRLSWWLDDPDAVPRGTRVGLTDVGALTYYTAGLEICDLVGLTTNRLDAGFPPQWQVMRQGLGTLWETLERWEGRPEIIITYPNLWTPPHQPELWLGEAIAFASLGGQSITSGQVLTAYRPDWSGVGSGDAPGDHFLEGIPSDDGGPPHPRLIIDTVDVADLISEAQHQHRWHHASERPTHSYDDWPPRFNTLRWQTRADEPSGEVIWDGGRRMSGGEEFTAMAEPGRPLRLVGRSDGERPARLRIRLDNGPWHIADVPGGEGWVEFAVDFPAEEVTGHEVRVEVDYQWDPRWAETFWHSYHWWLIQAI